ncbi:unnamed protein product [Effrenium voratum]|nr:unnamed protein product [Effrenium voratum]
MVSRRANEIQEAPESLEYGACEVYALPMEGARSALLQMQFVQAISFTVVIVDSYKVSREIGASMAASGLLVGIFMAGAMVGNALMTAALCLWPETWRKLQSWLQLCLCSDVLSVLSYVLLLRDLPGLGVWALRCLLLCRFCWGLGMGVAGQLASVVISQVTLPSDLPDQMQRLQFWQSLGLGVGPPVAAFGLWAAEMLPDQLGTELASSSVLILLQANRSFQWHLWRSQWRAAQPTWRLLWCARRIPTTQTAATSCALRCCWCPAALSALCGAMPSLARKWALPCCWRQRTAGQGDP